jgi:hypothetical protein
MESRKYPPRHDLVNKVLRLKFFDDDYTIPDKDKSKLIKLLPYI